MDAPRNLLPQPPDLDDAAEPADSGDLAGLADLAGPVSAVSPAILIVDDDPDTGPMLVELLSYIGMAAESVTTLSAAVRLLGKKPYALVLADYVMGSLDGAQRGVEALIDAAHPIPVGILSGWQLPLPLRERLAFALLKPASSEQLVETLAPYVTPQTERPGRRRQIARYFAALTGQAWDELASLCSADVVYHLPSEDPRFGRTVTGRMAFRDHAQEVFSRFPDPRFDVTGVTWLSYGAVVRYVGCWRGKDGKQVEHPGVVVFAFDGDDRINRVGVRTDLSRLATLL